jgi:hypothetical protein
MAIEFRGFPNEGPEYPAEGFIVIEELTTYMRRTTGGEEHTVRAISADCRNFRELNWWIDEAIVDLEKAREKANRFFRREEKRLETDLAKRRQSKGPEHAP